MDLLSHLKKDDRHPGVLADRNGVLPGDLKVAGKLLQNAPSQGRFLLLPGLLQRVFHILCQKQIGFYAHFLYRVRDL